MPELPVMDRHFGDEPLRLRPSVWRPAALSPQTPSATEPGGSMSVGLGREKVANHPQVSFDERSRDSLRKVVDAILEGDETAERFALAHARAFASTDRLAELREEVAVEYLCAAHEASRSGDQVTVVTQFERARCLLDEDQLRTLQMENALSFSCSSGVDARLAEVDPSPVRSGFAA